MVNQNEQFPSDLILISSVKSEMKDISPLKEEEIGMCYIESKNLDGETNMKFKQAKYELSKNYHKEEDFSNLTGLIECTPPNEILNDFGAKYYYPFEKTKFINIDKQSLLLRGCILKQTLCIMELRHILVTTLKWLKISLYLNINKLVLNLSLIIIFTF